MQLSAEKIIGHGYRFAGPLAPDRALKDIKLTSPSSLKLRSRGPYSDHSIGATLSLHGFEVRTHFNGEKGRVNVPVSTPAFIEDAAAIRKWVTASARKLLGGAEPCSVYRAGSEFRFQFSSDPAAALADLAERFPQVDPNDFTKDLILYSSSGRQTRDLPLLDAWLTYQILEKGAGFREIYQTSLRPGLSYKFVFQSLKALNRRRQEQKLPRLDLRPTFSEIESAVEQLRKEIQAWPDLARVAEALNLSRYYLELQLGRLNQARIAANQPPLYLS